MKPCPTCRRSLADVATACFCGWIEPSTRTEPATSATSATAPRLPPSAEERQRVRVLLDSLKSVSQPWTRARFIEHWRAVAEDPNASLYAAEAAREALAKLLAEPEEKQEPARIPGADDE